MKPKNSKVFIVFVLVLFAISHMYAGERFLSRTQVLMGTYCTISLEENRSAEIQDGFEALKKVENILSSYQEDALVYKLNRDKNITFDATLKKILQLSKIYYTQTDGYFDITIGSITKELYHFGENERIPTYTQKQQAHTDIEQIKISDNNITIGTKITIDLGGIGKGFAVDELSHNYHLAGITRGKIALSGDIRCLDRCSVQIQDPFTLDGTIATLNAKASNLSVSTSGNYRHYIQKRTEHHLFDPKNKTQGKAFVSVTIVAVNNNTLCDAMATAISVMPYDTALKLVRSQNLFGYLLITPEGKIISGNLDPFVITE